MGSNLCLFVAKPNILTQLYYLTNQMCLIPRFLQSQSSSTAINTLQQSENGSDSLFMLEPHKQMLPYLLTFILDIAIFFALYQYRRYAIVIHALIAALCTLTTLITALPLFIHIQIPTHGSQQTHTIIGLVVLILILVQLTAGLISKALQCISDSASYGIFWLNRIHKVNGYMLALLSKVEVYLALWNEEDQQKLYCLLIADVGLMALLVVRKATRQQLQSLFTAVDQVGGVPLVETIDRLGKDHSVGVFANYIYDLSPLQRFHPMGFQIIQTTRGRDLDRFLFGSAPTEQLSSIPPHAHSVQAIKLLGPSLAKLHIPSIYGNLEKETTPVRIKELVRISEHGDLYEVRLVGLPGEGFPCRGYSSILQLGRYFVLNLDGRVSRLYITVSFLAPANIQLLEQIYFRPNKTTIYSISMLPFNYSPSQDLFPTTERTLRQKQQDYLPLLIKKYPGGLLSSKLIGQEFKELMISEQRGQGLRVDRVTAGQVVVFLGGTGIIPFGDLIDLLFKAVLLQTHPQYRSLILARNPLLESDCLKGFSFRFFLEEHYSEDIHPLTRAQLIQLTKYPSLVQFTLKCHERVEDGRLKRSGVRLVKEGLEEMVRTELAKADEVVQYWVCCSPVMSAKIRNIFEEKKIGQHKYAFL